MWPELIKDYVTAVDSATCPAIFMLSAVLQKWAGQSPALINTSALAVDCAAGRAVPGQFRWFYDHRKTSLADHIKEKTAMNKIKIQNNAFVYPMPMVIVGAEVEGRPNYMAAAWVSRVNFNPPMIGIALGKLHHTNKGIHEYREFGISVPGIDLMTMVDYIGLVSGAKTDKSDLFESFSGELRNAPMVRNCPLTMECRVVQVVDLPSNEFFVGEIVGAYTEERFITDGKPDIKKINPYTLTMPDNRYWSVGEQIGKAWSIGKEFKKI
jgi:flavin reductase (DIM6/NTAB) family NADH-FMN oxidoreductase RutF